MEKKELEKDENLKPETPKEEEESVADVLKNVVEELKETRKERGIYKELYEGAAAKVVEPEKKPEQKTDEQVDEDKITSVVKKLLNETETSRTEKLKKSSLEKFIAEHKEYHPDNDPSGIKRSYLESKLKRFNTDGMELTDYESVIQDAHRLAGGSDTSSNKSTEKKTLYSPDPVNGTEQPKKVEEDEFTEKEKKMLERTGFSAEKYKQLKEKNPDFVNQILNPF